MSYTELLAWPFWLLTRWFYGRALRVAEVEAYREYDRLEAVVAERLWRQSLVREQKRQHERERGGAIKGAVEVLYERQALKRDRQRMMNGNTPQTGY